MPSKYALCFHHTAAAVNRFIGLQCPLCEQSSIAGELCELCCSWLQPLTDPCPGCGAPNTLAPLCGRCQHRPPLWQQLRVAWPFAEASRFLIHQMKYHQDYASARALAKQWLLLMNAQQELSADALLPVPVHRSKMNQRGFNQAQWLAAIWSQLLGIPVWQGVDKVRSTPALEGLNRRQRKAVLKGVFEVTQSVPKRLIVVDDVLTTGATLTELGRELLLSGAQQLEVWTLARTPLGD